MTIIIRQEFDSPIRALQFFQPEKNVIYQKLIQLNFQLNELEDRSIDIFSMRFGENNLLTSGHLEIVSMLLRIQNSMS